MAATPTVKRIDPQPDSPAMQWVAEWRLHSTVVVGRDHVLRNDLTTHVVGLAERHEPVLVVRHDAKRMAPIGLRPGSRLVVRDPERCRVELRGFRVRTRAYVCSEAKAVERVRIGSRLQRPHPHDGSPQRPDPDWGIGLRSTWPIGTASGQDDSERWESKPPQRPDAKHCQPRPMKGIFVAITVMNCTFASSGSVAM